MKYSFTLTMFFSVHPYSNISVSLFFPPSAVLSYTVSNSSLVMIWINVAPFLTPAFSGISWCAHDSHQRALPGSLSFVIMFHCFQLFVIYLVSSPYIYHVLCTFGCWKHCTLPLSLECFFFLLLVLYSELPCACTSCFLPCFGSLSGSLIN